MDIRWGGDVAEAATDVAPEEKKMHSNPWLHPEFWACQANPWERRVQVNEGWGSRALCRSNIWISCCF